MLPCICAYTQVLLHRLLCWLLQSLTVTLDQRCTTQKVIQEEGLTLVPPLAEINQIHHVLSTPSLKSSELPLLQPCPTSSLVIDTSSDIPDVIPDLLHVLHSTLIKSSPVSLASFLSESSALAFISQLFGQQFASMFCSITATVASHPGHRVAPVLSDGMVTPSVLLDWENACDDFFVTAKEQKCPRSQAVFRTPTLASTSGISKCAYMCLPFLSSCPTCVKPSYLLNWDKNIL